MTAQSQRNQPRYYQPLDVPPFIYLWEAVMWVTFGRFPTGHDDDQYITEEVGKFSVTWEANAGGPGYRFRGFWYFETEMAGLEIDEETWAQYADAIGAGYIRPDELSTSLANAKREEAKDPLRARYWVSAVEKQIKDQPLIENIHSLHQHHVDRGWAKVFQALVEGQLTAYGSAQLSQDEVRMHLASGKLQVYDLETDEGNVFTFGTDLKPAEVGPLWPMALTKKIETSEWSLLGIAPDARYTTASGRRYWDVCIPGNDFFERFPRPFITAHNIETDAVDLVNPYLAIGSAKTEAISKPTERHQARSPGRPKLAGGEIERACQLMYSERWASTENKDSIHLEAAAFAKQVWGEVLPRATFQGYMSAVAKMPKTPPEIAPEIAAE